MGTISALSGLLIFDGFIYDFQYSKATARFMRSLRTATVLSVDYAWFFIKNNEKDEEYNAKQSKVHLRSANRLLETCLQNGGLYIKIGQGVAAINHILPKEYTETLSKLENECRPKDMNDVRKVFLEDFGKLPEEIFMEFNYEPIAAASLAQVFKAKTKHGSDVAVKVQYHDLQERFDGDFNTIIFLQNIVNFFFKDYNFGWILHDLRENLQQELDFVNEGKNSVKCSKDLSSIENVSVPKVYWTFTKDRVLTTEWIDGYKITNREMIKKDNINLYDVDIKLFKVFSQQIFSSGFVHADPHPGNIFLRKNNGKEELIILDHGLYQSISKDVRLSLCQFWEATVLRDEKAMKKYSQQLQVENYKQLAEILFQTPINYETSAIKTKLTEKDIEYMQEIAKQNFDRIMQTLKEMPRTMLFVVRNLNTIRAISREHGDPVDRPKFMARYAQRCIYAEGNIFFRYIKWFIRRVRFEYHFFSGRVRLFILKTYLDVLYKLGYSVRDSSIIKEFQDQVLE